MTPRWPRSGRGASAALAALLLACSGGADPATSDPCGTPGPGWLAFIDRTTGPFSIAVSKVDGSCARTVASHAGGDLSPSWSAAAGKLAYTATEDGETTIRVQDLATGSTDTLSVAPLILGYVALSPDGTKLAFDARDGVGSPDVYVMDVSGAGTTAIAANAASDTAPAWSPEGSSTIYFVSNRTGAYEIWAASVGSAAVQVTSGSKVVGGPTVSPDGQTLAYSRQKPDNTSQIVARDLGTGTETVLSDDRDGEPAYDADGTRIAVSTYRFGGGPDVAVLEASTGELVQRITDGVGASGSPAFPR